MLIFCEIHQIKWNWRRHEPSIYVHPRSAHWLANRMANEESLLQQVRDLARRK